MDYDNLSTFKLRAMIDSSLSEIDNGIDDKEIEIFPKTIVIVKDYGNSDAIDFCY